jgi:hypothetical protein
MWSRSGVTIFQSILRFDFCIPTVGKKAPAAPKWFHEVKYDG